MPIIRQKKLYQWLIPLVLLLVMMGALSYWYYAAHRISPEDAFRNDMVHGIVLFNQSSPNAVQSYMHALNEATNPKERLGAQFSLGLAYSFSDRHKMVDTLKAIVADTNSPPEYRAEVINYLMSTAFIQIQTRNDPQLVDYIFQGSDWHDLLEKFTKSPYYTSSTPQSVVYVNGVRIGYLWSMSIVPTPEAAYGLAEWYSFGALIPNNPSGKTDIALAGQYLEQGDAIVSAYSRTGFPSPIGYDTPSYLLKKEITRVELYRLGVGNDVKGMAAEMITAISTAENLPNPSRTFNIPMMRYTLASLLALSHAPADAIHTVLAPFYEGSLDANFLSFLKNQHNASPDVALFFKPWGIALAQADPQFHNLLVSAGWQDADFKK